MKRSCSRAGCLEDSGRQELWLSSSVRPTPIEHCGGTLLRAHLYLGLRHSYAPRCWKCHGWVPLKVLPLAQGSCFAQGWTSASRGSLSSITGWWGWAQWPNPFPGFEIIMKGIPTPELLVGSAEASLPVHHTSTCFCPILPTISIIDMVREQSLAQPLPADLWVLDLFPEGPGLKQASTMCSTGGIQQCLR